MSLSTTGQKVKFLRNRQKVSQFHLEMMIGAAAGSISRIEADKVNPSKETLLAISKALELSKAETAYLFGIIDLEFHTNKDPEYSFVLNLN